MLSIARFSVAIGSAPVFSSTIFERVVHDLLGDASACRASMTLLTICVTSTDR